MFDPNKPVRTRGGRPARILATDVKSGGCEQRILALVDHGDHEQVIYTRTDGRMNILYDVEYDADLINIPQEKWALLKCDGSLRSYVHDTRAQAAQASCCGDIIVKIIEE